MRPRSLFGHPRRLHWALGSTTLAVQLVSEGCGAIQAHDAERAQRALIRVATIVGSLPGNFGHVTERMGRFRYRVGAVSRLNDRVDGSRCWPRQRHHQRHDHCHRNHQDDAFHKRNLLVVRAVPPVAPLAHHAPGAHLLQDVVLSLCPLVQAAYSRLGKQYVRWSTKEEPELLRTPFGRSSRNTLSKRLNKGKKKGRGIMDPALLV